MVKIVLLDLNKVVLYGFEPFKSDLVIDALCNGIMHGDQFPIIPVRQDTPWEYELTRVTPPNFPFEFDGGHHRAVAHFIMGVPLRCTLVKTVESIPSSLKVDIRKIHIVDDKGEYLEKSNAFNNYRMPICWE